MGLGLYIIGKQKKNKSKKKIFNKIEEYFLSLKKDLLSKLIEIYKDEDMVLIYLHPAEEPIEFSVNEENNIVCSAKTSSAGPGYHAYLIALLEKMEEILRIEWIWSDEDGDIGDETGYYENKNFKQLQNEILKWLHYFSKELLKLQEEHVSEIRISLPTDFPTIMKQEKFFAMSSLGYWEEKWFETIANSSLENISNFGIDFFPWWNKEPDALFWLKTALVLLWTDCPWHEPISEGEVNLYYLIHDCLEEAYKLNKGLEFPWHEWMQILTYLKDEKKIEKLKSIIPSDYSLHHIGFHKEIMLQSLTGGWKIEVPGYFYNELERNGETSLYWYEDKTIQSSSFSLEPKEKTSPNELVDTFFPMKNVKENIEIITFETETLMGKAGIMLDIDEDSNNDLSWLLQGVIATKELEKSNLNLSTICYNKESDKDWAIKTWKSIIN